MLNKIDLLGDSDGPQDGEDGSGSDPVDFAQLPRLEAASPKSELLDDLVDEDDRVVFASALTGDGAPRLLAEIDDVLRQAETTATASRT